MLDPRVIKPLTLFPIDRSDDETIDDDHQTLPLVTRFPASIGKSLQEHSLLDDTMGRPPIEGVAKNALVTKSIKPTVKVKLSKESKNSKPPPPPIVHHHDNRDLAPVSPKTFNVPRMNVVSKPSVKDLIERTKPSSSEE